MSANELPTIRLENQIVPVTDVDRAKSFYQQLGWRLDDDVAPMEGLRFVQFTPPGSPTSITFGLGLPTGSPGGIQATLVVSDIEADPWPRWSSLASTSRTSVQPPFPVAAPVRPRPRANQLRVVLLLQRSRRQLVACPRGHHAAPRPGVIGLRRRFPPPPHIRIRSQREPQKGRQQMPCVTVGTRTAHRSTSTTRTTAVAARSF